MKTETTQTKAISYVRFSSAIQAKGRSKARQSEKAEKYCIKNNLDLDDSFYDEGLSAYHGKHADEGGEFKVLLDRANTGHYEKGTYLIVEALDRLSRQDVLTQIGLFANILKSGLTLVTLIDKKVYTWEKVNANHVELIVSLSLMAQGHTESAKKGERVSDAWLDKFRKAKEGKTVTRILPAWVMIDPENPDKRVEIPERVKIIKRIFNSAINENKGSHVITRELNDEGLKPWTTVNGKNKSGLWSQTYISKLLRSRALLGEVTFNGTETHTDSDGVKTKEKISVTVDDYYPVIITEEELRMTAMRRHKRKKGVTKGRSANKCRNIFSGILKCVCGSHLNYSSNRGYGYLVCAKGSQCEHVNINYHDTERVILETIPNMDWEAIHEGTVSTATTIQRDNDKLNSEIHAFQIKLDKVVSDYENNPDLDALLGVMGNLKKQINGLKSDLKPLPSVSNVDYSKNLLLGGVFSDLAKNQDKRQTLALTISSLLSKVTAKTVAPTRRNGKGCVAVAIECVDGSVYYVIRNKVERDVSETAIYNGGGIKFDTWISDHALPYLKLDVADRILGVEDNAYISTYYSDMISPTI